MLINTTLIFSENDSISNQNLNYKIQILQNKVDEVKRDQINYSIEKNLLKDTYSNNYDKINLFITGILLVFGSLGYLGLKDINSIKKEYKDELDKLKKFQLEIESKSNDFEKAKDKYDSEITKILKDNEEQNRKLKVLEIKEQIDRHLKDRKHEKALEYCIIALEFSPNDIDLLRKKSQIYSRILKYDEAIKSQYKILEIEPNNNTAIYELAELLYFAKKDDVGNELIKKHSDLFSSKEDGQLLFLFELLNHFNKSEVEDLKEKILNSIDKTNLEVRNKKMLGWDLYDALVFIANQPDSEAKLLLQNFLWYMDAQINAQETLERLGQQIDKIQNEK